MLTKECFLEYSYEHSSEFISCTIFFSPAEKPTQEQARAGRSSTSATWSIQKDPVFKKKNDAIVEHFVCSNQK